MWTPIAPALRPATIADGYRLQRLVHERLSASGNPRVGWKIGSTSAAGQRVFGLTEPVYAGLFASGRAVTLVDALARPLRAPSLECEIAFVLGAPLAGSDLSDAMLADAVAHCHIACEIIDNRYGAPLENGVPSLLADGFFHAGYVIGPENVDWRSQPLERAQASITIDGTRTTGAATGVLSAFASLRWLAGKLAGSEPLQAGDVILTGSITTPVPIAPPARDVTLTITGFAPLTLHGSA